MDQIGEIILRLRINELEAHLVLREIERAALNREIEDPKIDADERYRKTIRRDRTIIEWGEVMTELQDLRERYSRELALLRNVELN
jgi:hypothetical protein